MTDKTPLDRAHAGMEASDAARLAFFSTLADTELFVLLERDPQGDKIDPRVFELDEGAFVLAFDTEARLAEFAQSQAAYAAVPGRILAGMLGEQGFGLGLNLDVAPSAMMLPTQALAWLDQTLRVQQPNETEIKIEELFAPKGLPEALLSSLAEYLTKASGLARMAALVEVVHQGGGRGHLLAIVGAEARVEPALARAVNEALVFSGLDAGVLDVAFFAPDHPVVAKLLAVGMVFDIPEPQTRSGIATEPPGSNPDRPPKLR